MKKALLLSLLCLFMSTGSFAQIIQSRSETKETYFVKPTVEVEKKYPRYQGEFNFGYVTPSSFLMETVHGVRINKYAFAGLGLGLRYGSEMTFSSHDYEVTGEELIYLPIYVNLKGYYPVTDKIEPFLNLSLGYAADMTENESSGFYCDFGAGVRLWKFALGLGLLHQNFSVEDEDGDSWSWGNTGFYLKIGFQW